jgi:uncharacterized phiE125 gp8 family phage protein
MTLKHLAGPALEPVTLAEAKLYVRVDGSAEDGAISLMITAARELFERETGLILNRQSFAFALDQWPLRGSDGLRRVYLPVRGILGITSAAVSIAGVATPVASTDYVLDADGVPPRFVEAKAGIWQKTDAPANGIEIVFDAGFGDDATDVPSAIRLAILKLVAESYEGRGMTDGGTPAGLTERAFEILAPYREARL